MSRPLTRRKSDVRCPRIDTSTWTDLLMPGSAADDLEGPCDGHRRFLAEGLTLLDEQRRSLGTSATEGPRLDVTVSIRDTAQERPGPGVPVLARAVIADLDVRIALIRQVGMGVLPAFRLDQERGAGAADARVEITRRAPRR